MNENENVENDEQQLVVLDLAQETYGVDINTVREIIQMQEITKVPKTLDFVEGIINLRGKVIPVVDLRKRFGLPITEQNKDSRIVVVDIDGQSIGIVVDGVSEVLRISNDAVEPPSSMITTMDSEYLRGIAKLDERLIIMLDLTRVFTEGDQSLLAGVASPVESMAG